MATPVKILILAFVMLLLCKGDCWCDLQDVEIVQSKTGATVLLKPQWNVTVTINKKCDCIILDAILFCRGFQTVEHIEPSVLRKEGDECVLNNGHPITQPFSFFYAWDDSYPFKVGRNFKLSCA